MSSEENKWLVRRSYEEVVSTGAVDVLERFVSPDYVEVHDGERYALGLEGAREYIRGVRRTYPDLRLTVEGGAANLLGPLLEAGAIRPVKGAGG